MKAKPKQPVSRKKLKPEAISKPSIARRPTTRSCSKKSCEMDVNGISKSGGTPSFDLGISQPVPDEPSPLVSEDEGLGLEEPEIGEPDAAAKKDRHRHNCVPAKLFKLVAQESAKPNWARRHAFFMKTGFGDVMKISNWRRMPINFVTWVVKNYDPSEQHIRLTANTVLPLRSSDVNRVYNIPRGGLSVLADCTQLAKDNLRVELGIQDKTKKNMVPIPIIEEAIKAAKDDRVWSKLVILYMLGTLLCPKSNAAISLEYATILEDFDNLTNYDWSQHVLDHLKKGIIRNSVRIPKADFHFLLVNYIERMGRDSQLERGEYEVPTCQGWNPIYEVARLSTVEAVMSLDHGITFGWAFKPNTTDDAGQAPVYFDADRCPIEKVPIYAESVKAKIVVLTTVLETLEDRMKKDGQSSHAENVNEQTSEEGAKRKTDRSPAIGKRARQNPLSPPTTSKTPTDGVASTNTTNMPKMTPRRSPRSSRQCSISRDDGAYVGVVPVKGTPVVNKPPKSPSPATRRVTRFMMEGCCSRNVGDGMKAGNGTVSNPISKSTDMQSRQSIRSTE